MGASFPVSRILAGWLAALAFLVHAAESAPAAADAAVVDSAAPEASMNERVLMVPVDAQRTVRLQVTVLQPSGPGPFPVAVMNHGAAGQMPTAKMPRFRHSFAAYYFLSRGYAVVLPMMRGHAGSEGRLRPFGCNQDSVALDSARDIQAVIDYLATDPTLDTRRIVMAGQSFGGWNTLAFGSLGDPRVKGLVNFVGGMAISNCLQTGPVLARGAERFATTTRVPSVWFYGDNDSFFAKPVWQAMHQGYTSWGGRAELVAFGTFMKDAHALLAYPEGLKIWAPRVDRFLENIGLPAVVSNPQYLPHEFPEASGYAAIEDVAAVPYLDERGREFYKKFLERPLPRVYVISRFGYVGSFYGGFDPMGRGLKDCAARSRECQVYAVDDDVVWQRPTPAPPASDFAHVDDVAAVPFVSQSGREGYQKYLAMRRPKAFAVAPDGAWSAVSMGSDPVAMALENCGRTHQGCRLYAVDHSVVWNMEP
jgi:dienelactone hydrolase